MKKILFSLSLSCICATMTAQSVKDTTDLFFRHLKLNELVVTGVTGDTKLKNSTFPITLVSGKDLRSTASTNIVDAIAHQPGVAQITTGSGISKPIIRGLGYNRIITMSEGVRQEGQQWGDEHGIEVDANNVNSVEILKGPASLMYGSDAMAGVVILHPAPILPEGEMKANVSSEYQTNNGLIGYSLNFGGNQHGIVWDARYSGKFAHTYKNKYDGYVPGSQFREQAARLMFGLNKQWGHSHLIWTTIHQTPSIIEGERDEETGVLTATSNSLSILSSLSSQTRDARDASDTREAIKSYSPSLPFQQIKHYKAVWDNSFNLSHGWLKAIVGYQQNRRQEFEESEDEYELFFKLHTLTYDLRYLSQDWNGWKLAGGINGMWQQSQNLGEETLIPDYKLFDIGGYATVSKTLDRLTLNGGLRYDHRHLDFNNRNFGNLTGSIGTVWNISDHTNLRLNLARGFRAPNMSELGSDGVHEGTLRYEIGNPDLKAEYSWQADLGLDFTSQYFSAQIALFANRIENYIFAKRIGEVVEEGYRTYDYTQGDARLLGFEAGFDFHPIHAIHFENTFSYVDARQLHADEDTKYLPMTPAPRWTSDLKFELSHDGQFLNNSYVALGLEAYMKQDHYYKADDTETATPGYALISVSAGADLIIQKRKVAELYVTADNLLNKAYQNHLSRLKYTDINSVTGRQGVYNMGRNITFKVVVPIAL